MPTFVLLYASLGGGHSDRYCYGSVFCLLVGCVEFPVLHLLPAQCSIVNGASSLYCGE